MVRGCAYPRCTNKMTKRSGLSFHRLPFHTPKILQSWLAALRLDVNTPIGKLRDADLRVCGVHFSDQDFFSETARKTKRKLQCLKRSAVPGPAPGHDAEEEEEEDAGVKDLNLKDEPNPVLIVQSEVVAVSQPLHKAVKCLQGSSIFKTSEVLVHTQCLLDLFQLCWLCHRECCITIDGYEKLFSIIQDCQSCGYHRQWRSHPTFGDEPVKTIQNDSTGHVETSRRKQDKKDLCTKFEHLREPGDRDSKEVVVQIDSSDHEDSEKSYDQMFIETDGSYLSGDEEEKTLQEERAKKKRRKYKKQDSGDEWEPPDEENSDSDVSMDEDLFTALKEDNNLKLVVLCTECETEASLSCSLHRHKKLFCCAHCSDGDDAELCNLEKLPVRFEDFGSFQRHAEKEHGAKPFHKLCQECGKYVIADPESKGLKDHKCEHKTKHIVCPACGKKFLTEVGLKRHYTKLHEDSDHPCKYCLKVFKNRPSKLEHEKTHPKEKQPYSCPDCSEKFDNLYKRNNHLKSHRGPYKYFCDICKKSFKNIIKLKRHKLIHSGEKPYKCQVCERSFNQMENLSSHMRVHTGEKPYMCEQCGECFNHNVSLKNHKLRHHSSVELQVQTQKLESDLEN